MFQQWPKLPKTQEKGTIKIIIKFCYIIIVNMLPQTVFHFTATFAKYSLHTKKNFLIMYYSNIILYIQRQLTQCYQMANKSMQMQAYPKNTNYMCMIDNGQLYIVTTGSSTMSQLMTPTPCRERMPALAHYPVPSGLARWTCRLGIGSLRWLPRTARRQLPLHRWACTMYQWISMAMYKG